MMKSKKKLLIFFSYAITGVKLIFESIISFLFPNEENRRSIAFTVSMIAISAKLAKADGVVTESEIRAFTEIFDYSKSEEKNIFNLFQLAQQSIVGYEIYARKLQILFSNNREVLIDILDSLFYIAKADGEIDQAKYFFLLRVAKIFQVSQKKFNQLKEMHGFDNKNPYLVLGVEKKIGDEELKKKYRQLVKGTHPDHLIAKGAPEELIKTANDRLAEINSAWEKIVEHRKL